MKKYVICIAMILSLSLFSQILPMNFTTSAAEEYYSSIEQKGPGILDNNITDPDDGTIIFEDNNKRKENEKHFR